MTDMIKMVLSNGSDFMTLDRVKAALGAAGFQVSEIWGAGALMVGVDDEDRAEEFEQIVRSYDPEATAAIGA